MFGFPGCLRLAGRRRHPGAQKPQHEDGKPGSSLHTASPQAKPVPSGPLLPAVPPHRPSSSVGFWAAEGTPGSQSHQSSPCRASRLGKHDVILYNTMETVEKRAGKNSGILTHSHLNFPHNPIAPSWSQQQPRADPQPCSGPCLRAAKEPSSACCSEHQPDPQSEQHSPCTLHTKAKAPLPSEEKRLELPSSLVSSHSSTVLASAF